ncbi:MAG: hypothetical protein KBF89_03580 [Acidimicrobiia bacterium]|nr:hypothetical protein [Acidimicrobiia bacterium]
MKIKQSSYKIFFISIIFLSLFIDLAPSYSSEESNPKVVIISIPRVTWKMLDNIEVPNINSLIENGSTGSLSILTPGKARSLENGYISISAGNRANAAPASLSTFYSPDEIVDGQVARNIFIDQRGSIKHNNTGAIALNFEYTIVKNSKSLYEPDAGAFATALKANNKTISVIGNADYCSKLIMSCNQRAIAYLGSDNNGEVENAEISRKILNDDLTINNKIVKEKTIESIKNHDVTAVECSDLEKLDAKRISTSEELANEQMYKAIKSCDGLIGSIKSELNLNKDQIYIISPVSPRIKEQLTVFVGNGKGIKAGYATSGITRREGIISLADIAPSILDFYHIEIPNTMIATLLNYKPSSDTVAEKKDMLISVNEHGLLRDSSFVYVAGSFILIVFLSIVFSIISYKKIPKLRRFTKYLLYASISMPTITFLIAPFMMMLEKPVYIYIVFAFLTVFSSMLAYHFAKKYKSQMVILVISTITLAVQLLDIITGGNLQLNSYFGYSTVVAGRFAGFGNLAFSIVAISSVVIVAMVKQLAKSKQILNKRWVNIFLLSILMFVLIMDGLPYLGSDVGGVLALTPMVFTVGLMLFNKRIDYKTIFISGFITIITLSIFSLFDLSRPLSERTHLGRFIEVLINGEGKTIIERKILLNIEILSNSLIATLVIFITIYIIFLFLKPERFIKKMILENPAYRYIVYPGLIVGILGMLLNDSGVAIPGMMLSIAMPPLALLAFEKPVKL